MSGSLPDELTLLIFSYLTSKRDLFAALGVCREWRRLACDRSLWSCRGVQGNKRVLSLAQALALTQLNPTVRITLVVSSLDDARWLVRELRISLESIHTPTNSAILVEMTKQLCEMFGRGGKLQAFATDYLNDPHKPLAAAPIVEVSARYTPDWRVLAEWKNLRILDSHLDPARTCLPAVEELHMPLVQRHHVLERTCPNLRRLYFARILDMPMLSMSLTSQLTVLDVDVMPNHADLSCLIRPGLLYPVLETFRCIRMPEVFNAAELRTILDLVAATPSLRVLGFGCYDGHEGPLSEMMHDILCERRTTLTRIEVRCCGKKPPPHEPFAEYVARVAAVCHDVLGPCSPTDTPLDWLSFFSRPSSIPPSRIVSEAGEDHHSVSIGDGDPLLGSSVLGRWHGWLVSSKGGINYTVARVRGEDGVWWTGREISGQYLVGQTIVLQRCLF